MPQLSLNKPLMLTELHLNASLLSSLCKICTPCLVTESKLLLHNVVHFFIQSRRQRQANILTGQGSGAVTKLGAYGISVKYTYDIFTLQGADGAILGGWDHYCPGNGHLSAKQPSKLQEHKKYGGLDAIILKQVYSSNRIEGPFICYVKPVSILRPLLLS